MCIFFLLCGIQKKSQSVPWYEWAVCLARIRDKGRLCGVSHWKEMVGQDRRRLLLCSLASFEVCFYDWIRFAGDNSLLLKRLTLGPKGNPQILKWRYFQYIQDSRGLNTRASVSNLKQPNLKSNVGRRTSLHRGGRSGIKSHTKLKLPILLSK